MWKVGDFFAFVAEPETAESPGDVLYVDELRDDCFLVRVWCAEQETSGLEVYRSGCLTERLSHTLMVRAAVENWPADVRWLRTLLAN